MAARLSRALVVAALSVGLAGAEREISKDGMEALTVESNSHFKRLARSRAHVGAAGRAKQMTLYEARHKVLAHISSFSENPQNVGNFHLKVQEVLLDAVKIFSGAHPDVRAGITRIGQGLFEALEMLLPKEAKEWEHYSQFRAAWMKMFVDLPETDREVREHIKAYNEDARPELIGKVVAICVKAAMEVAKSFMPEDVQLQVNKYFDGVVEIMDGIVLGWSAFAEGKTVQGIEFVFDGLKDAADDVLPEHVKNNEAYKIVMGTLDMQVRKLNDHVLMFKRKLLESKVCWRDDVARQKTPPMLCGSPAWPGFYYSGQGYCRRAGSSLLQQAELNNRTLDEALNAKNNPAPAPPPPNSRRAICDYSKGESELGEKCAAPCQEGYVQTEDGARCMTKCFGNKSFAAPTLWTDGDGKLCGQSPQMLQMVQAEMAVAVVAATMKVIAIIQQMIEDGKATAEAISSIIDGVISIAVPFVNPECEVEASEEGDAGEQASANPPVASSGCSWKSFGQDVPDDEGKDVGKVYGTPETCRAACDATAGCKSFSRCGTSCHLKDKVVEGEVSKTWNQYCTFDYKVC